MTMDEITVKSVAEKLNRNWAIVHYLEDQLEYRKALGEEYKRQIKQLQTPAPTVRKQE